MAVTPKQPNLVPSFDAVKGLMLANFLYKRVSIIWTDDFFSIDQSLFTWTTLSLLLNICCLSLTRALHLKRKLCIYLIPDIQILSHFTLNHLIFWACFQISSALSISGQFFSLDLLDYSDWLSSFNMWRLFFNTYLKAFYQIQYIIIG